MFGILKEMPKVRLGYLLPSIDKVLLPESSLRFALVNTYAEKFRISRYNLKTYNNCGEEKTNYN